MSYKRKTVDEYQLLCDYGYGEGWEYVLAEDTIVEARKREREYRENSPRYQYKVVKRRVKLS